MEKRYIQLCYSICGFVVLLDGDVVKFVIFLFVCNIFECNNKDFG